MKNFDLSKFLFNSVGIVAVFLAGIAFTAFHPAPRKVAYFIRDSIVTVYEERFTLTGVLPSHFLQAARHEGDGVTVNALPGGGDDLVLLSGFFEGNNQLRLIRRDGGVVARWPVVYSELVSDTSYLPWPPAGDWNVDIHGALIEPDGSVVFNLEYSGLVKLNRCGKVLWTLPRMTHHSVEPSAGGGYWVPARRYWDENEATPYPPFQPPLLEDTLLRVSQDGEVLKEIPLVQVLYDNGLEPLITATGHSLASWGTWDGEILHVNKIQELPASIADDFPMFEAGDLAISIRESNLVLVMDPDDGEVKWWRVGPWLRQHDPEFKAGGTIVVFNNNVYKTAFQNSEELTPVTYTRGSTIVEIDPASGRYETIYGDAEGQKMLTVIRGKVELRPGGGLLITEFEGGRAFETDAEGKVVWEFINRYSADQVAEVTEARAYPQSYFNVTNWSCGN
ncbi:arylsulfotransferase family protein [Pelagibius marinus]|uniref:arylsulfotransferase family protein n=1 Tax=Pelagibius marinus TaxID=2762760 RepID=UPI0018729FBC|nr:arylsulfotransferase family protein [Pelagibius marinus]